MFFQAKILADPPKQEEKKLKEIVHEEEWGIEVLDEFVPEDKHTEVGGGIRFQYEVGESHQEEDEEEKEEEGNPEATQQSLAEMMAKLKSMKSD